MRSAWEPGERFEICLEAIRKPVMEEADREQRRTVGLASCGGLRPMATTAPPAPMDLPEAGSFVLGSAMKSGAPMATVAIEEGDGGRGRRSGFFTLC